MKPEGQKRDLSIGALRRTRAPALERRLSFPATSAIVDRFPATSAIVVLVPVSSRGVLVPVSSRGVLGPGGARP
jgi:hypothetical protein